MSKKKEKTIYQINANKFEHFCVKKHEEKYNQHSIHWSKISDDILFDIGFITDYHAHRENRRECLENNKIYLQEYGLDGIAFDEITKCYNALQFKNWNPASYINADKLGSFLSCMFFRIWKKFPGGKGYVYHTCRVSKDFRIDSLNSDGRLVVEHVKDFNQEEPEEVH